MFVRRHHGRYLQEGFGLFAAVLIFVSIEECFGAYTPPKATVEPLYPVGLRISIPDEQGISLVAFHVKFNDEFLSLEAGTIARDIIRARNGRWTYEDRTTELKRDDMIYYWVHVVYNGLGYNLLNQEYRVTRFFNYDGTPATETTDKSKETCTTFSDTLIVERSGERRQTCPGELIFEDNFESLNTSVWKLVEEFSGAPDHEFVVYRNSSENVDVIVGTLRITPTFTDEKYGSGYVRRGTLTLDGCTGTPNTVQCTRTARGSYILPPVMSGRLHTKETFTFLYGRVEVRAKLPRGDWIYPLITLENVHNTGIDDDRHSQIRIGASSGNIALRSQDGIDLSGHVLYAGALVSGNTNLGYGPRTNRSSLPQRHSNALWSDAYHVYEIEWRAHRLTVKVDGVEYGAQDIRAPFNEPFYLNLGLAVGGYNEFPDMCVSNDYEKPWRNVGSKALFNFYSARDQWMSTWTPSSLAALNVDYVKVYAL